MTTDHDARTRTVLSWLREDAHENAERVLLLALDEVDATPQRRSWWPAWRFLNVNSPVRYAIAAAAVLVVALLGYQFLPGLGVGTSPTPSPAPTPAPLAVGNFISHGVTAQLDAHGTGAEVTGTLSVSDEGGSATVTLECTGKTSGGLIVIGGLVTDSTYVDYFPEGHRVGVIFERGSPVKAVWWVSLADEAPLTTCAALLEQVSETEDEAPAGMEPIEGSVELAP
jgi:hypothetical protein